LWSALSWLLASEYSGKALVPRLQAILQGALELLRPTADLTEPRVQEINMEVTLQLTQVLGIAEDARLEGRHSGVDPDRVIEAAGTLRRIVHRLSGIASGRLALQPYVLPAELQAARAACDAALLHHLQSWLEVLEEEPGPARRHTLAVRERRPATDLAAALAALQERLSALGGEELAAWPVEARSVLLTAIESYHRLMVLVSELDQHLVKVPAAKRGSIARLPRTCAGVAARDWTTSRRKYESQACKSPHRLQPRSGGDDAAPHGGEHGRLRHARQAARDRTGALRTARREPALGAARAHGAGVCDSSRRARARPRATATPRDRADRRADL
jgi:hypothetical protein